MNEKIISIILTGGRSSRMNFENKSFLKFNGITFIETIINSIKTISNQIYINANQDSDQYKKFGYPIVEDSHTGHKGPLAGIHSVLEIFKNQDEEVWFAVFPTDAPIINLKIFEYYNKIDKKNCRCLISKIDNIIEPMFSMWSSKCYEHLDYILKNNDGYKIMKFAEEIKYKFVEFEREKELEFFNVNNFEDYEKLQLLMKSK